MISPKSTIQIVLFLCNFPIPAQPALTWQNPLPQGFTLNAQTFFTPETGIAVGDRGTAMKTTDGGEHWKPLPLGVTADIKAIQFVTSLVGYLGGGGGTLLKTKDGGETWARLDSRYPSDIEAISFLDEDHGYAGAHGGRILKTENGGQTWTWLSPTLPDEYITSMHFIDENTGIVTGQTYTANRVSSVYQTEDGGKSWKSWEPSGNRIVGQSAFHCLHFPSPDTGYAAGDFDSVYQTLDSGKTWHATGALKGGIFSTWFLNGSQGFAIGAGDSAISVSGWSRFSRTEDGGKTWNSVVVSRGASNSLCFAGPAIAYLVGTSGSILKSIDGGLSWQPKSLGFMWTLQSLSFPTATTGYAASWTDTLLKTTDRGIHWKKVPVPGFTSITKLRFADESMGWFLSRETGLFQTHDGGSNWEALLWDSSSGVQAYDFPTRRDGYAASLKKLRSTSDGGATWKFLPFAFPRRILSVVFASPAKGLAVTGEELITGACSPTLLWSTKDSGQTWDSLATMPYCEGTLQHFSGPTWTFQNQYQALRSDDDGESWRVILRFPASMLVRVQFLDDHLGYAVLYNGKILRSSDAGTSWDTISTNITPILYDAYLLGKDEAILVGTDGAIFRYGDPVSSIIAHAEKFPSQEANAIGRNGFRYVMDRRTYDVRGRILLKSF